MQFCRAANLQLTFPHSPKNFTHLKVWAALREDAATNDVLIRFNNDSGANYYSNNAGGNNASSVNQNIGATAIKCGYAAPSTAAANEFGFLEYFIPFYTSTSFLKKAVVVNCVDTSQGSAGVYSFIGHGTWNSTAAITRLTWVANSNYVANSRIQIYGF
jgi:hypothetical protein